MFKKIHKCEQHVTLVDCPDPFKDKVKCNECKCWVDKTDAQKINCGLKISTFSVNCDSPYKFEYYCQSHKKPYDERMDNCIPRLFYKKFPCDENGQPIGYTKIKK